MKQTVDPIFSESQRFRQWLIWILVAIGPVIFTWAVIQQLVLDIPFGNNPSNDTVLVILTVIFGIAFPLFLYRTGLDTEVGDEGIRIRFWPFHRQPRVFYFTDVENVEAVTYSPLKDYGGWGIRYGTKGKAYNVRGNQGVVLTLKSGESILIGSQHHETLCSVIEDRL
jgi:hypothetical protein